MKKILLFFILSFTLLLIYPRSSFSFTKKECADLAAKALTNPAADDIIRYCKADDNFFFKNEKLKCAIRAGEAKTETAADEIMYRCR